MKLMALGLNDSFLLKYIFLTPSYSRLSEIYDRSFTDIWFRSEPLFMLRPHLWNMPYSLQAQIASEHATTPGVIFWYVPGQRFRYARQDALSPVPWFYRYLVLLSY